MGVEHKTAHWSRNHSSSRQILNVSILRRSFCGLGFESSYRVSGAWKVEFLTLESMPVHCTCWMFGHPKHAIYDVTYRSQWPRGLMRGSAAARLLGLWVRIPPERHGYLSVVSVACCQVEVSVSGWSLVQRSPTECGVSECDHEASIMRGPWYTGGCCVTEEKSYIDRISWHICV